MNGITFLAKSQEFYFFVVYLAKRWQQAKQCRFVSSPKLGGVWACDPNHFPGGILFVG